MASIDELWFRRVNVIILTSKLENYHMQYLGFRCSDNPNCGVFARVAPTRRSRSRADRGESRPASRVPRIPSTWCSLAPPHPPLLFFHLSFSDLSSYKPIGVTPIFAPANITMSEKSTSSPEGERVVAPQKEWLDATEAEQPELGGADRRASVALNIVENPLKVCTASRRIEKITD